MKKLLVAFFLVLVFAGTAFYFGWTSFAVPLGDYGVLTTKTSGVSGRVVESGRFAWNWERLLPTNARLSVFSPEPREVRISNSGTLPSGDLYGAIAGGNPDFSWKIDGTVSARINPDRLPSLVREGVDDQKKLELWIDARVASLVDSAVKNALSLAISGELSEAGSIADKNSLTERIRKNLLDLSGGDFIAAEPRIDTLRLPDTDMYRLAKKAYLAYLDGKAREFAQAAAEEAKSSAADQYVLDRFEKWGELLTKYPILVEFLAVSNGNAEEALTRIRAVTRSAQ